MEGFSVSLCREEVNSLICQKCVLCAIMCSMILYWTGLVFLICTGLAFGSFANVVIHRLKLGKPLKERSRCPRCHAAILVRDLVPIFSWLRLGGRCRACHQSISCRYPMIEALVAGLFLITYIRHPFFVEYAKAASFIFEAASAWVLVVIAAYDFEWQLIPMPMLWAAIGGTFLWQWVMLSTPWPSLAMGAAFGGAWMLFLFLLSKGKWIGSGDIWLAILIGICVGWPAITLSLYITYLVAGLVAALLLVSKHKRLGQRIAFAPFLVVGVFGVWWFGGSILAWLRGILY